MCSCGSILVDYDYDESADFTQFKSYNFLPDMESGLNELDEKRLITITDSLLQAQGFVKSDTPDILINVFAEQYENNKPQTIGVGVGGAGRNIGIGGTVGIPLGREQLTQSITLDFINAEKNALIWQAISESKLKFDMEPQERTVYFTKVLSKVFENFPPK